jgi:hypothetical protein
MDGKVLNNHFIPDSMPQESRRRGSQIGGCKARQKERMDKFIKFLPDEKAGRKVR